MNNKGYTLVDLLIGLMIMLMVITISHSIILLIYKMNDFSYQQNFNTQDSRLILNYITNEINYAKAVTTVSTNQLQYTDKDDNSTSIMHNNSGKAVEIYKNGLLFMTLGKGNITSITFENITPVGVKKKAIKINIGFVSGDSITTNVMTMTEME